MICSHLHTEYRRHHTEDRVQPVLVTTFTP